jgi:hypothetical protein
MLWKAQFQMAVNWTTGQKPRQFLRRKLVEGLYNVLPLSAVFNLSDKFCLIDLKVPKDFICRLYLSNGLGLKPRKEKSRFGCFWTLQWAFENPAFSPVVHRNSRPADGKKSISLSIL